MRTEILTYGINEQRLNKDQIDIKVEELHLKGFTILENIFSKEEMSKTAELLDLLLEKQIAEIGGRANMQKANDDDLVRCPLAYSPHFLELSTNKIVLDIIRRILGENFVLLMQNGIVNRPENKQYQVRWHRDMNYQHWTSSRMLAINFLICIDKFYKDGGCTWALPGSHLHAEFPSNEYIINNELPMEAEAGSIVVMDAMTYHRSGINVTPGYTRRALNHVVGIPMLMQQIDIPRFLESNGHDYSADPFLARYLGYKWNPAISAHEWRIKHTKKVEMETE